MSVNTIANDDRGGAKRAFSGMRGTVEFNLCATIATLQDTRFFDLGLWQIFRKRCLKIKFADRRVLKAIAFDDFFMAAVIAEQTSAARRKPHVTATGFAGKPAFLGWGFCLVFHACFQFCFQDQPTGGGGGITVNNCASS